MGSESCARHAHLCSLIVKNVAIVEACRATNDEAAASVASELVALIVWR